MKFQTVAYIEEKKINKDQKQKKIESIHLSLSFFGIVRETNGLNFHFNNIFSLTIVHVA